MHRTLNVGSERLSGTLSHRAIEGTDGGVLSERGMLPGLDGISAAAVLKRLSLLSTGMPTARTSTYVHRATTLDDLCETSLAKLSADAFKPWAVVETSASNFHLDSSIRERFRSSSEPLPRRHWPSGTAMKPARRTEGARTASRLHELQSTCTLRS
ncbi:DNA-primase RepB domain-containing protein [Edaphobacter modestus]|nr:DNA-primase RepB domain-containing protein [Edaphobacter modestus]